MTNSVAAEADRFVVGGTPFSRIAWSGSEILVVEGCGHGNGCRIRSGDRAGGRDAKVGNFLPHNCLYDGNSRGRWVKGTVEGSWMKGGRTRRFNLTANDTSDVLLKRSCGRKSGARGRGRGVWEPGKLWDDAAAFGYLEAAAFFDDGVDSRDVVIDEQIEGVVRDAF